MHRVKFSIPWPWAPDDTRELLTYAFQVALATYLLLLLLENIRPGFVSFFLSLNFFLWVTIITGILANLWPVIVPAARRASINWKDWLWIGALTLGTMLIVYVKLASLNGLGVALALLCGLVVLGVSLLVYYREDDDAQH
ncbi:MAG: hypothetical protein HY975_04075 [Candidatus Kerfeldbacteria bacterium]|nr:hypothetical protein [Candidatus Kerfeldbacteria bacterium]